jgi:hypothetical protein
MENLGLILHQTTPQQICKIAEDSSFRGRVQHQACRVFQK